MQAGFLMNPVLLCPQSIYRRLLLVAMIRITIKALTPVEDFNDYFGMVLPDDEFDTIGGLVVHEIGHLPRRGERIVIGNLLFKVLRADGRRVHMLQLTLLPGPAESRGKQTDNAL